ncbi:MAG: DUF3987 domain-containing protein [Gemmataceae bacterium]
MTNTNPYLAAALDYAGHGWPVLPLHNPRDGGGCSCRDAECIQIGKHPRTEHGVKDATTDPKTIRGWWRKWPDANVGVATGAAAGVWMLGPDGDVGLADLEQLAKEHGPLPATRRGRSGSGGAHLIFRWPTDGLPVTNRRNHRGLKIDVRGAGGYFVAPPSANANGSYQWTELRDPADAPPWLLAWVRGTTLKFTATARPGAEERARAYLRKCEGAVSGQDGHGRTFAVSRALAWGFALPEAVVLRLLRDEYNPRCTPPWSEAELAHKAKDAATKDYGKPFGHLLDDDGAGTRAAGSGAASGSPPPWPPPVPLPTLPPVPEFPLGVFPEKVADYWRAAAASLHVPVDYVAVPGLALLGAAVGRSRAAEVKPGYTEVPLFWVAVVAPPGSTKSASLALARAPLAKAERAWLEAHRKEMTLFDAEADRHAARMKEWKTGGCEGEPPAPPRRPVLRQATLDDTTTEAAAKVMADNPRGVVVVKDELSAFVGGMDQYRAGRGADKQFWLSAWACAMAKVNRAKDHALGPMVIPHPFAAVCGMLCPDALAVLRGENRHGDAPGDGFLDRFLISFPDPLPAVAETFATVPAELSAGYAEVVLDLLGMEMVPESDGPGAAPHHRPYFVRLSPTGRQAWREFTEGIAGRMNALDKADPFRGVLSKLKGYGARFAALLWSLRRVCGPAAAEDAIDVDVMVGAAALVDYFIAHAARAHGRGWADRSGRIARRLLAKLARHPEVTAFTRTQAFQWVKDKGDVTAAAALAPVFSLLVDHGYIRPVDRTENARPGPIPETYMVNPAWDRSTWK